jgi:hypothetical protein
MDRGEIDAGDIGHHGVSTDRQAEQWDTSCVGYPGACPDGRAMDAIGQRMAHQSPADAQRQFLEFDRGFLQQRDIYLVALDQPGQLGAARTRQPQDVPAEYAQTATGIAKLGSPTLATRPAAAQPL